MHTTTKVLTLDDTHCDKGSDAAGIAPAGDGDVERGPEFALVHHFPCDVVAAERGEIAQPCRVDLQLRSQRLVGEEAPGHAASLPLEKLQGEKDAVLDHGEVRVVGEHPAHRPGVHLQRARRDPELWARQQM